MERIDIHPTHSYQNFKLRRGKPSLSELPWCREALTSIFQSRQILYVSAVQKHTGTDGGNSLPDEFRLGMSIHSRIRSGLRKHRIRLPDGRAFNPKEGYWFDSSKILLDPYAKVIGGRDIWAAMPDWNDIYHHRARVAFDDFDWEDDRPLEIPPEDQIIYEMHVRSFSRHPSSGEASGYICCHPGKILPQRVGCQLC